MSRKLPLDPKLGVDANVRLHQLWVDAAIVTRDLQDQIDLKAPSASPTFTGTVTIPTPFTLGATSVTATGAELNLLDGVTATTAELNILDGVTSTATEINLLDGITALAAGTYSPTMSNIDNAYSLSASTAQYLRISGSVTVSGKFTCNTTDATVTTIELTLPVASTFTADTECAGVAYIGQPGSSTVQTAAKVFSQNTGTKARVEWKAGTTGGAVTAYYTYTYQVL